MQKKIDKILLILYLLFPFIDFITGYFTWQHFNVSIGLMIKGIFFVCILFYLLKNYLY